MFSQVEPAPPVKVFQLTADYNACTGANKQNLGVGGTEWAIFAIYSRNIIIWPIGNFRALIESFETIGAASL